MMQNIVNSAFLLNQVRHWLATPTNSYLGSGYGIDLKAYLHKPMNTFDGDAIIDKLRRAFRRWARCCVTSSVYIVRMLDWMVKNCTSPLERIF